METRGHQKSLTMKTRGCMSTRLQSIIEAEKCCQKRSSFGSTTKRLISHVSHKHSAKGSTAKTSTVKGVGLKDKPKTDSRPSKVRVQQGSLIVKDGENHSVSPCRISMRRCCSLGSSGIQQGDLHSVDSELQSGSLPKNAVRPGRSTMRLSMRSPSTKYQKPVTVNRTSSSVTPNSTSSIITQSSTPSRTSSRVSAVIVTRSSSLSRIPVKPCSRQLSSPVSRGSMNINTNLSQAETDLERFAKPSIEPKKISFQNSVTDPERATCDTDTSGEKLTNSYHPVSNEGGKLVHTEHTNEEVDSSEKKIVDVVQEEPECTTNGTIVSEESAHCCDSKNSKSSMDGSLANTDSIIESSATSPKQLVDGYQVQSLDLASSNLTPVVCLHKICDQSVVEKSVTKSNASPSQGMQLDNTVEPVHSGLKTEASTDLAQVNNASTVLDEQKSNVEDKKKDVQNGVNTVVIPQFSLESLIAKVSDRVKSSGGEIKDSDVEEEEEDEDDEEILGDSEDEGESDNSSDTSGSSDGEGKGQQYVEDNHQCVDDNESGCVARWKDIENAIKIETNTGHDDSKSETGSVIVGDNSQFQDQSSVQQSPEMFIARNVLSLREDSIDEKEKVNRSYLREYKKLLTASLQKNGSSQEIIDLDDEGSDLSSDISKAGCCSDKDNSLIHMHNPLKEDKIGNGHLKDDNSSCTDGTKPMDNLSNPTPDDKCVDVAVTAESGTTTEEKGKISSDQEQASSEDKVTESKEEADDDNYDLAPEDKVRQLLRKRKEFGSKALLAKLHMQTYDDDFRMLKAFEKEKDKEETNADCEREVHDVITEKKNEMEHVTKMTPLTGKEYEVIEIDGTLFRAFDCKESLDEYVTSVESVQDVEDLSHETAEGSTYRLGSPRQKHFRYGIAGNVAKYLKKRNEVKSGLKKVSRYLQRDVDSSASHKADGDTAVRVPRKTDDITKIKGWRAKFLPQEKPDLSEDPQVNDPEETDISAVGKDVPETEFSSSTMVEDKKVVDLDNSLLRILLTQNVRDLGLHLKTQRGGIRSRNQSSFQGSRCSELLSKPSTQVLKKKNIASIEEDENQPSKGWIYGRRIDGKFATKAAVNKIKKKGRNPVKRFVTGHGWSHGQHHYIRPQMIFRYVVISKRMAVNAVSALHPDVVKHAQKTSEDVPAHAENDTFLESPTLLKVKGELPSCGHPNCSLGQACSDIKQSESQDVRKKNVNTEPSVESKITSNSSDVSKAENVSSDPDMNPTENQHAACSGEQNNDKAPTEPTNIHRQDAKMKSNKTETDDNPVMTSDVNKHDLGSSIEGECEDQKKTRPRRIKKKKNVVTEPVRKCSRLKGHKSLAILERANSLIYYDTSWWSLAQKPKKFTKRDKKIIKGTQRSTNNEGDGVSHNVRTPVSRKKEQNSEINNGEQINNMHGELKQEMDMNEISAKGCARTNIYTAKVRPKKSVEQQIEIEVENKSVTPAVVSDLPPSGYINTGSSDMPIITSVQSLSNNVDSEISKPEDAAVNGDQTGGKEGGDSDDDGCQITHVQLGRQHGNKNKRRTGTDQLTPPQSGGAQKKVSVQMVMLQKKSKGKDKNLELLEIRADCDWSSVRTPLLSKISSAMSKMANQDGPKDIEIGDFIVSYCKNQTDVPVPIPSHMQRPLVNHAVKEMVPVRFTITTKKAKDSSTKGLEHAKAQNADELGVRSAKNVPTFPDKQKQIVDEEKPPECHQGVKITGNHPIVSELEKQLSGSCHGGMSSFNHFKIKTGTVLKSNLTVVPASGQEIVENLQTAQCKLLSEQNHSINGGSQQTSEQTPLQHTSDKKCGMERSLNLVLGQHSATLPAQNNKRKDTTDSSFSEAMLSRKKRRRNQKRKRNEGDCLCNGKKPSQQSVVPYILTEIPPEKVNVISSVETKTSHEVIQTSKVNLSANNPAINAVTSLTALAKDKAKEPAVVGRIQAGDGVTGQVSSASNACLPQNQKENSPDHSLELAVEKSVADMPILIPEDVVPPPDDKDVCSSSSDSPPLLEPQLDPVQSDVSAISPLPPASVMQKNQKPLQATYLCEVLTGNSSVASSRRNMKSPVKTEKCSVNRGQGTRSHSAKSSLKTNRLSPHKQPSTAKHCSDSSIAKKIHPPVSSPTVTSSASITVSHPVDSGLQRVNDQGTKSFSKSLQSLLMLPESELTKAVKQMQRLRSPLRMPAESKQENTAVSSTTVINSADHPPMDQDRSAKTETSIANDQAEQMGDVVILSYDSDHTNERHVNYSKPITIEPLPLPGEESDMVISDNSHKPTAETGKSQSVCTDVSAVIIEPSTDEINSGSEVAPATSAPQNQTVLEIQPQEHDRDNGLPHPLHLTDMVNKQLRAVCSDPSPGLDNASTEGGTSLNADLSASSDSVLMRDAGGFKTTETTDVDVLDYGDDADDISASAKLQSQENIDCSLGNLSFESNQDTLLNTSFSNTEDYEDARFEDASPHSLSSNLDQDIAACYSTYKCSRERKRRFEISNRFQILQDLLYPDTEKMAKQIILNAAIKTLDNLQAEQDTLNKMKLQLSKKRDGLILRLRSLKGMQSNQCLTLSSTKSDADNSIIDESTDELLSLPRKIAHKRKLDCSAYAPSYAELAAAQMKLLTPDIEPTLRAKLAQPPSQCMTASELVFAKKKSHKTPTTRSFLEKLDQFKKERARVTKGSMAKRAARCLLEQALSKAKNQVVSPNESAGVFTAILQCKSHVEDYLKDGPCDDAKAAQTDSETCSKGSVSTAPKSKANLCQPSGCIIIVPDIPVSTADSDTARLAEVASHEQQVAETSKSEVTSCIASVDLQQNSDTESGRLGTGQFLDCPNSGHTAVSDLSQVSNNDLCKTVNLESERRSVESPMHDLLNSKSGKPLSVKVESPKAAPTKSKNVRSTPLATKCATAGGPSTKSGMLDSKPATSKLILCTSLGSEISTRRGKKSSLSSKTISDCAVPKAGTKSSTAQSGSPPNVTRVIHLKSILAPITSVTQGGKQAQSNSLLTGPTVSKVLNTNQLVFMRCKQCGESLVFSKNIIYDVVCPSCKFVVKPRLSTKAKLKPPEDGGSSARNSKAEQSPVAVLTTNDGHQVSCSQNAAIVDVLLAPPKISKDAPVASENLSSLKSTSK